MSTPPRRPWRKEEDARLCALVAHLGSARGCASQSKWGEVATHLPGRTAKDCRKRWFHSLDPTLKKGRWTESEDKILLGAYARLGPAWKEIADLIPGRKDDQCSKRYNEILNPLARGRLNNWTLEEDAFLVDQVIKFGHKWAAISVGLPGRPPLTCRNRWRTLCRPEPVRSARRIASTSPSDSGPCFSSSPNTEMNYEFLSSLKSPQDTRNLSASHQSLGFEPSDVDFEAFCWTLDDDDCSPSRSNKIVDTTSSVVPFPGSAPTTAATIDTGFQSQQPINSYDAPSRSLSNVNLHTETLPSASSANPHFSFDESIDLNSTSLGPRSPASHYTIEQPMTYTEQSQDGSVRHVYHHHIFHHQHSVYHHYG